MEARNSMERKKEQARRERENQARLFKEEQRRNDIVTNVGLFSEPVKTTTIDPIAKRVQDTLGKCRVENYRDAIGITHQPATPLPKDKKMSFPDVEIRRQDNKTQSQKPEVEGTKRSLEDKIKPKNVHAKSHQSYVEKQRGTSSHDQVPLSDKKSHQQVLSSSSSKSKADHNNPKKEHQSPKLVKKEHITPTKNGPVNGRGSEEKGEGSNKSKVHSVNGISALKPIKNPNLPPLLIKEDHSVEDILKEMTQWHQPHTAIQTPHKDEMKFPFPASPPTSKAPYTVRMSVSSTSEPQTQRNPVVEGPRRSPVVNQSHLRYPERDKAGEPTVRASDTADSKYPKVSVSGPGTNAPTKEQRMNSGDSSSSSEDESDSNDTDSESQSSEEDDKSDDNEEEDEEEEEEEKVPAKHKSPINSSLSDKGHDTSKSSTCSTWALSNFIKNVESPISQLPSSNDNSKLSDKPNMTISEKDNDQVISDMLNNIDHAGSIRWSPVLPTTKHRHTQQKSPFSSYSEHQSPPSKNSNRTSVNEKLKTSTPESKSRFRKEKSSGLNLSDEDSQSENEEIDVESVTPGKEIIPEILRRNAGSVSDTKKRLEFERTDSECVSRVTPSSLTGKKNTSKTKDKRDQTKSVSKRQDKENKENNEKENCCDDIKNIFEQITVNPPLSPIPNVPENSNPKSSIPGLTYDNSGKPRIIVRFNLSLLAKPIDKCNTSQNSLCSNLKDNKMCSDIKSEDLASNSDMDIDDDIVDSKVLIEECPKPESPHCNMTSVPFSSHYSPHTRNGDITSVKRRSDLDFHDNRKRARSDSKRNSLGSSRERVSHSDNHEWDMKHPQRSECKERRHSSSSNSSQPRGTSRCTKETKNQSTEPDITAQQMHDKEEFEVPGNGPDNSGQYPSSVEMSSYSRGGEGDVAHVPSPQTRKSAKATDEWCTLSSDTYFRHARELKHQADTMNSSSDKLQKAMKYLESFIAFIQCGYAMERGSGDQSRIFSTYRDTNKLVSHISRLRGNHESNNNTSTKEKIVSVLSFRIQSLLNLKLYKMKKNETERLKRAIEDYNKTTTSKPAPPISHAPSPHQNSWSSRSNRTPSPMSPTPSPVGSTGSLESRGSSTDLTPSKLPNGNVHMSSASITYPQRIHSITQQYITNTGYLVQAHDFWEQADSVMQEVKGFFEDVEEHSEVLTLLSSIPDLICFLQKVVEKLKDT